MDPLTDTTPLPELSFDDLLDISPIKKNSDYGDNDPLEFDEDKLQPEDETLNTPGPKKPPATKIHEKIVICVTTSSLQLDKLSEPKMVASPSTTKLSIVSTSVTRTSNVDAHITKTTKAPVLLNTKNILPKTATPTGQIIKIAKATPTTSPGVGKTAVKTANGQILFIQKTGNLPAVRLQSKPTTVVAATTSSAAGTNSGSATTTAIVPKTVTTTTTIATKPATVLCKTTTATTPTTSTTTSSNKMIGIQIVRTADGSIVPVKTFTTTAGGSKNSSLSLPSKIASPLTGKKIISSSGGQLVIKAPLKSVTPANSGDSIKNVKFKIATTGKVTATSTGSPSLTTTTTTASTIAKSTSAVSSNPTAASLHSNESKIVMQSASGKQVMVTKQNLIKLSPSTSKSGEQGGAGQLHAIQIPGKQGLQYVRVLPNSKITTISTTTSTATSAKTSGSTTVSVSSTTSASSPSNTGSSTPTTTTVKLMNPVPQKFTVVRPTSTTKIMLTQSPKKDGNVTFLPVTSKVQKTLVAVPKPPGASNIVEKGDKGIISTSPSTSQSQSIIKTTQGPSSGSISIIKKHKISEINKEIGRVTGEDDCRPPAAKKPANGNHIVLMPRSIIRSSTSTFPPRPGTIQRVTVQSTPTNTQISNASKNLNSLTSKKLYSVLKNSNLEHAHAKVKSLIICGQAQARMVEKKPVNIKRHIPMQWAEAEKKLQQVRATQISNKPKPPSGIITVAVQIKKEVPTKKQKQLLESDAGPVRRKHCNCSKSQCLKLYCDCFANGEFCQDCTCKDCFNNLQYEDERQRAIKSCLERNPSAFKPKITTARDQGDMRLHNKGCNCKRSGCLKNYCECYEAKIPCSSNCKCVGCRNVEDRPDFDLDPDDSKHSIMAVDDALQKAGHKRTYERINLKMNDKLKEEQESMDENETKELNSASYSYTQTDKPQCNFITAEVIDATLQCMISQAEECEKNGLLYHQTEKMVLEELGRCLVEIIDFSIRNSDTSFTQEN